MSSRAGCLTNAAASSGLRNQCETLFLRSQIRMKNSARAVPKSAARNCCAGDVTVAFGVIGLVDAARLSVKSSRLNGALSSCSQVIVNCLLVGSEPDLFEGRWARRPPLLCFVLRYSRLLLHHLSGAAIVACSDAEYVWPPLSCQRYRCSGVIISVRRLPPAVPELSWRVPINQMVVCLFRPIGFLPSLA